jgi:L-ascorbate metabolism protein UlaG (beta-lactamase superfamily)
MSAAQKTRITWLGHATVLVQTGRGTNILIDPFIAHNPKYPKDYSLPSKIHYVLLTHGHGDHISDAVPVATRHGSTVAATMVEAKHSAAAQDERGSHYVGIATGFVLSLADGPALYHAGDTSVFGDMSLIRELFQPKVAMLPIGGHYTMGPKEAALAGRLLGTEVILPLHFGTFPPLKGTPEELAALVDAGTEVVCWKPGDEYSIECQGEGESHP